MNPFEIKTNLRTTKAKSLDWDESAADTTASVEDVHDGDRNVPEFILLRLFVLACFAVLAGRLFYLQVVQGGYFNTLAENNRVRRQVIEAPRGMIQDRTGQDLLQNIAGYNLVAVPLDLPKEALNSQVKKVSMLLGLDEERILKKLQNINYNSINPIVVFQDLSSEKAILFETNASEFLGFSVQKTPIRDYFDPIIFSHVIGYTGLASPEDVSEFNLRQEDSISQVGKQGLEVQYEKYLRGQSGEALIEVDASGKLLKVLGEMTSEPGNTLVLNIDAGLQKKIYQELTSKSPGMRAAAVAINPKNGEVLALLSLPGFDNNIFAHGIKQEEYSKMLNDPGKPFLNRAISGLYPPGSTVKPVVSAAALSEGVVNENTIIVDNGVLVIPHQYDPQIAYNFYGWKRDGLGAMNVRSAIAKSSDIYFYTVTGGHPSSKISPLGIDKLSEYYYKFHAGKVTEIDLPGEKAGVVANPEWKAKAFADDPVMKKWYLGNTYHVGIGQGDMLSTPLQVTFWTSVIANNGVGMKPVILNRVQSPEGKEIFKSPNEILVQKFLSDNVLKIVQEGMRETILSGSGVQLNSLGISSAGKTGTSQFDGADPKRTHAWFTAYAPFENPEIAITVLVEAGGEGHAVAVPVVKETLKWWEENRYGK